MHITELVAFTARMPVKSKSQLIGQHSEIHIQDIKAAYDQLDKKTERNGTGGKSERKEHSDGSKHRRFNYASFLKSDSAHT